MNQLAGSTAFITAGAQGLGRGIALALAEAGADIIIAQRDMSKVENVINEIKALGREAIAVQLDVTDSTSVESSVQAALTHFPHINILVNNAGVDEGPIGGEITLEKFDLCYDVNVKGIWRVVTRLAPHFKENGGGKIVNIASIAGRQGNGYIPAYCASKAAAISLTQSLAMALGPDNINVNAICPGPIRTAMSLNALKDIDPNYHESYAKEHTQLKRLLTPEDIGQAVLFFVSPQAKNITGQSLNVDGGHYMN